METVEDASNDVESLLSRREAKYSKINVHHCARGYCDALWCEDNAGKRSWRKQKNKRISLETLEVNETVPRKHQLTADIYFDGRWLPSEGGAD